MQYLNKVARFVFFDIKTLAKIKYFGIIESVPLNLLLWLSW